MLHPLIRAGDHHINITRQKRCGGWAAAAKRHMQQFNAGTVREKRTRQMRGRPNTGSAVADAPRVTFGEVQ